MEKLNKLKKDFETLRDTVSSVGTDDEKAKRFLRAAKNTAVMSDVTDNDFLDAGPDGVITRMWSTGSGRLHYGSRCWRTVAKLTHTEVWKTTADIDGERREIICICGFAPDVEFAMTVFDYARHYVDSRWEDYKLSPEYLAASRSDRHRLRFNVSRRDGRKFNDMVDATFRHFAAGEKRTKKAKKKIISFFEAA